MHENLQDNECEIIVHVLWEELSTGSRKSLHHTSHDPLLLECPHLSYQLTHDCYGIYQVEQIFVDQYELTEALPGDNIKMKIKGVEDDQLRNGFVICRKENMCRPCRYVLHLLAAK